MRTRGTAARRWRLALLTATLATLGFGAGCGDDGAGDTPDAGPDTVAGWHEADYPYRVRVQLNAHPERDRADVPVLFALSHAGGYVQGDVRVYEQTSSGSNALDAGAWSQPDGTLTEVGFTASGTTPANDVREFLVYYRVAETPAAWTGTTPDWATFEEVDRDANGTRDGFLLRTDRLHLQRELRESDDSLQRGRDDEGDSHLTLLDGDWTVVEGFANGYQLETLTETFDAQNVEDGPVSRLLSGGDPFSAAAAVTWDGRSAPLPHDLLMTYRAFRDWPLLELVVSASVAQPATAVQLSSAAWSSRRLYLASGFDRMVSDNRGDEALEPIWDTSMRWLVVYDSQTSRGFGWFLNARGVVRAAASGGEVDIYDSYGYSADGTTGYRYLWMAAAAYDDIVTLFDAMLPGVTLASPERRDLNIVTPRPEAYYFPDDALEIEVTTPGHQQPVTATLTLPDQSTLPVTLERSPTEPLRWRTETPILLTESHPTGTWRLTAHSAEAEAEVEFEFRLPTHPHLLFDAADLPALRARKDDPAYAEIWAEMLRQAESYEDPIPDPGLGKDIRSYADRLMNLGLIQLMDPAQPFDAKLWSYFHTMLRYPNWEEGAAPFNNEDLTVGHFLTALALIYDWHYAQMSAAERREVRDFLHQLGERWLSSANLRIHRDIDWHRYLTVTNNHYWINHQGVAAAAFVLADEIPDDQRSRWVDHLEENLAIILSVLEPDGTSNEGVAYHSYGQINLFRWLDMRDRAFGENSAEAVPWFRESVLWDLYSILPGGDDNYGGVANFGDCPPRHYQPPRTIAAWLAARLADPTAQWVAEQLDWPRYTAMSYLWYDPSMTAQAPLTALPPWRMFPYKGIFAWRSSWEDDATYFSLKSGAYFGGHEQPDAGHFILHRAGVPYITDHGYSYWKVADEHNLVLIDDAGQYGGESQWMSAVDPAHWAQATAVLADPAYFDLLADPTAMLQSDELTSWTREVVGLGPDLMLVHDSVDATAPVTVHWLLHSYRTDPPTSETRTYTYLDRRTENPFTELDPRSWTLIPQDTAPTLRLADVSWTDWTPTVEPSRYVPEQNPDTGEYNASGDTFQVGYRLHRAVTDTDQARSLMVLWWGDDLTVESWSTAQAEAARIADGAEDVAVVLWPSPPTTSLTGFHGFDLTGAMAGRRYATTATPSATAYFGRELLSLTVAGQPLVQADQPVDVFARLEHTASPADPSYALLRTTAASTTITLHCPVSPTAVLVDGAPVTIAWASSQLTVALSAGAHRVDIQ